MLTFFRRCLDDVDDEVRDRATLYLKMLQDRMLAETYVKDGRHFYHFINPIMCPNSW